MIRGVMLSAFFVGLLFQKTAPAPLAGKVARISGAVMAGYRMTYVVPVYPMEAKNARLSGTVVMRVQIAKYGTVEKVAIASSTNPVFNDSAMEAVRQWRYEIYILHGEPTAVDTTVTVKFAPNSLIGVPRG
jgi:protein TonB